MKNTHIQTTVMKMFLSAVLKKGKRFSPLTIPFPAKLLPQAFTHTDDCYEKVLICGLEEHTHTVDCLTDHSLDEDQTTESEAEGETSSEDLSEQDAAVSSDSETEISSDEPAAVSDSSSEGSGGGSSGGSDEKEQEEEEEQEQQEYELPSLTGYTLTDFTAAAESQIGYTESKTDYTVSDEAERKGYTLYGDWYGNAYGEWDAMFLAYCLDYAEISDDVFPKNSGAFAWYGELDELGCYNEKSEKEDYEPIPGDIVFFDTDDNDKPDRAGVVTAVDLEEDKLTVVEGYFACDDGYDRVCENEYSTDEETITGYGHIPDEDASAAVIYTAEDSGVNVKVTAAKDALPEDAELYVTLYDESRSEYTAAGEAIGFNSEEENMNMAVVDIAFSLDGEKTEPSEAVDVSIDISAILPETADPSTVSIIHLAETEEGIEPVLVADATNKTEGTIDQEAAVAEFTVDTFSDFTITWKDYDDNSSTLSIPITTYLYNNGITTTALGDGPGDIITNIDSSTVQNTVDLTSSNQEIAEFSYTARVNNRNYTYYCSLETAVVNLVVNGTSVSISDVQSMSVTYDSVNGYVYTITNSSGTVTYTDVTSSSIYLYYSRTTSGSSGDNELDATKCNADSYVYWDVFKYDDNGDAYGVSEDNESASQYISSVTMGADGQIYVANEDSSDTNTDWTASTSQLSDYFPNANSSDPVMENGTLTITPATGYYIAEVIIACCGGGGGNMGGGGPSGPGGGGSSYSVPYECQTWGDENAYDVSFSITSSGVMNVDVSSLYFSHSSSSDYYFILIRVAAVADPLYVQYDYGEIVDIIGAYSGYGGAFDSPDGWTDASSANAYGTANNKIIDDGDVGIKTENTQFKYGYDDPSETANWVHYTTTVTTAAKEEAAAAGYRFVGWYTEYYYYVVPEFYSGTSAYIYNENYVYTFDTTYYTTTYGENESISLPTHAKLTALWEPVELTITKTVTGLTGSDYESESHTYTLLVQRSEDGGDTWEDYQTVYLSVTGDGTASVTISPLKTGLYRIEETSGNTNLTSGSTTMYISVGDGDELDVTAAEIISGTTFSLGVANEYSVVPMERLPDTGGAELNIFLLAGIFVVVGLLGLGFTALKDS